MASRWVAGCREGVSKRAKVRPDCARCGSLWVWSEPAGQRFPAEGKVTDLHARSGRSAFVGRFRNRFCVIFCASTPQVKHTPLPQACAVHQAGRAAGKTHVSTHRRAIKDGAANAFQARLRDKLLTEGHSIEDCAWLHRGTGAILFHSFRCHCTCNTSSSRHLQHPAWRTSNRTRARLSGVGGELAGPAPQPAHKALLGPGRLAQAASASVAARVPVAATFHLKPPLSYGHRCMWRARVPLERVRRVRHATAPVCPQSSLASGRPWHACMSPSGTACCVSTCTSRPGFLRSPHSSAPGTPPAELPRGAVYWKRLCDPRLVLLLLGHRAARLRGRR